MSDSYDAGSAIGDLADITCPVGSLCRNLPRYVRNPPIEAVVFAWGVNEDGQLGLLGDGNVPTPKVVDTLLGVQWQGRSFGCDPLVAGSRNSLALDAEGGVWSWGWNARGTLGHGHRGLEAKPHRIQALAGERIVQVSVNGWHCLALNSTGQMFSWGGNEYMQCGMDADKRDIVTPVMCLPQLKVKMVACGGMHSLALAENGDVWTWGEPWGDFSMTVQREPRKVEGVSDIAAIAVGAFHNMALTNRGEVLTWGTNDYGQLGNGTTMYQTKPVLMHDLENELISDIAAGGWHSAALNTRGEVFIWGRGEYGRLGLADRTGSSKLRPQKLRGLESHCIVQISLGGTHSVALTSKGRVFIWGRGSYGRLGLGSLKDSFHPVELFMPGGCDRWRTISVSTGGRHTLCLALPVRDGMGSILDTEDEMDGASEPSLFDKDTMCDSLESPPPLVEAPSDDQNNIINSISLVGWNESSIVDDEGEADDEEVAEDQGIEDSEVEAEELFGEDVNGRRVDAQSSLEMADITGGAEDDMATYGDAFQNVSGGHMSQSPTHRNSTKTTHVSQTVAIPSPMRVGSPGPMMRVGSPAPMMMGSPRLGSSLAATAEMGHHLKQSHTG